MSFGVCRVCLVNININDDKNFTSAFNFINWENQQIKITDAVMECTSVMINPDDCYPKLICTSCTQNLQISYTFRQTCVESDAKLKEAKEYEIHKIELDTEISVNETPPSPLKIEEEDYPDNDHTCTLCFKEFTSDCYLKNHFFKFHSNFKDEDESSNDESSCPKCGTTNVDIENHVCESYNCSKCPRRFAEEIDKDDHEMRHDFDGTRCRFCNIEFETIDDYELHQKICSFQIVIDSKNAPFTCSACDKIFSSKTRFEIHLRTHSTERPFKCTTCNKRFKQNSHLNVHMRSHTGNKPYKCSFCSQSFMTNSILSKHLQNQHPGEIQPTKSKRNFTCKQCGKSFLAQASLDNHTRMHSGERPFVCEICAKAFKQSSHLTIHRRIHNNEKPFSCVDCFKRFITNSSLRKHVKTCHRTSRLPNQNRKNKNPKTRKCRFCTKTFEDHEDYISHIEDHNKDQNFMCEDCGTICKTRVQFQSHRRAHLDKPFTCPKCPKKFVSEAEIKRHELCHNDEKPYQCHICGEQFKWRITAWRHSMYHTGQRPRQCEFCNKTFVEAGALKRHMRVHTGERPQKCDICYRTFKEASHLKTHMIGVHKHVYKNELLS